MNKVVVVFFLSLFFVKAYSQRCATTTYSTHLRTHPKLEQQIQKRLSVRNRIVVSDEVYTIPVVVHVIHDNAAGVIGGPRNSNITDEQIYSQINVLNEDFRRKNPDTVDTPDMFKSVAADTKIQFMLATTDPDGLPTTGITRTYSDQLPFNINNGNDELYFKSLSYWPSEKYLNIWVTELSFQIIGHAQFPSGTDLDGFEQRFTEAATDGVTMHHYAFGDGVGTVLRNGNLYRNGRTLVHEVGHWLGLIHIWGDSESCFATDYCDDTPSQAESSATQREDECGIERIQCNHPTMYQNYMDYTPDLCMNLFTQDQADRMRAVVEVDERRKSLLTSLGLCGGDNVLFVPYKLPFESNSFYSEWSVDLDENRDDTAALESDKLLFTFRSSDDNNRIALESELINIVEVNHPYLALDIATTGVLDSILILTQSSCLDEGYTEVLSITDLDQNTNVFKSLSEKYRIELDEEFLQGEGYIKLRIEVYSSEELQFEIHNLEFMDYDGEKSLMVYPNPNNGSFKLKPNFEGEQSMRVQVFDMQGRNIYDEVVYTSYNQEFILNLDPSLSGVFIVKTILGEEAFLNRVLIVRD